jgi:hypothetical protein
MKAGKCHECEKTGSLVRWVHPPICEACHDTGRISMDEAIRPGSGLAALGDMSDPDTGGLGAGSKFLRDLTQKMKEKKIGNDRPANPNNREWLFGRGPIDRRPD